MLTAEQAKTFGKRLINFIRPKPRFIPLSVEQLMASSSSKNAIDQTNHILYTSGVTQEASWKGSPLLKTPSDLWTMIDLMQRLRPTVIVETGTHHGGSAHFFADMAKILGIDTQIITIDINPKWSFDPLAKNIISVRGMSTDLTIIKQVHELVQTRLKKQPGNVIVTLDSDHSQENVYKELKAYYDLVNVGSYLIAEDTNVNGHPSFLDHGPGPFEAVEQFLAEHKSQFVIDKNCERFLITFNPSGWLKRIS